MLYKNVNIEAFAYELPPEILSSGKIEDQLKPAYDRLKLSHGRLEMMTGIMERRLWEPGFLPSDAAVLAGRNALSKTDFPKDKIGCLINCSVCRDFLEPATATVVHHQLGLPESALVFDISNACLGVLTGMLTAANMIELGQIEAALLVAGENSRSLLETTIKTIAEDTSLTRQTIKPLFASLTIGSGACAVLLSRRSSESGGHRLLGGSSLAATRYNHLCRGNADKGMNDQAETLMNTDAETLMHCGIDTADETWKEFKRETGWTAEDIDCICTHQVGSAHKLLLLEKLGLEAAKDYATLEKLGNIGSVSCPITAAMAVEAGKIKPGEKLALLGIGSGINCTMLGVEW
jgi:3-oxoacyl-[acyl-carrier-protein] synthase-3